MEKKESTKILEIHAVYVAGGQTNPSYCITIPKDFARALKIDKPHSKVVTRLVTTEAATTTTEDDSSNSNKNKKRKRPYLIIEKEDYY